MPMITVAEYNRVDQIKPWESVWNRFFERTPDVALSHSFSELTTGNFGEETKLRILVALVADRPFGILPLKVQTRPTPLGTVRVLSGLAEPRCPFAGPLGPNTTAMLTAAFRHLQRTRRDWDMVQFRVSHVTEMLHNRLRNSFRLVGWDCDVEPTEDGADVPLLQSETNATRPGFRYTHLSSWAIRARWVRFRKQIQSGWKTRCDVPEIHPPPRPHMLSLYPPSSEPLKLTRPHARP